MENVKIKDWLENNPGYGSGYGDGAGAGSGYGSGAGSGYGSGAGYGSGCGDGSGYGSDYGSGAGYGYDYGSGYGDGIESYNGKNVYIVDGCQTIIDHIKGNYATGYILISDLTTSRCYIAKSRGYFAHGKTLKEAQEALNYKIFKKYGRR